MRLAIALCALLRPALGFRGPAVRLAAPPRRAPALHATKPLVEAPFVGVAPEC